MIRHTVVFALKHPRGSDLEKSFLSAAHELGQLPGVESFEQLAQVSKKNDYTYGLSMEFADQAAYDAYDGHPDHQNFVATRWLPEVDRFMEIDYTVLP